MDRPKKPNKKLQNERELRGWSQQYVAEALGTDFKRVSAWENGSNTPTPYYRTKLCTLFGKNARELGFLNDEVLNENSHQETNIKATDVLPQENRATQIDIPNDTSPLSQPIHLLIPGYAPVYITIQAREQASAPFNSEGGTFLPVDGQPQVTAYSSHEDTPIPTMRAGSETVNRRDFFRETGRVAVGLIGSELLDRFYRALKKPSTIDERLLHYLQAHTEDFWRDRHSAVLASTDLLDYVIEHFQKVTQLLDKPMFTSQRIRLCVIASKTAQLAGHLLFDMGNYIDARQFHQAAITAAQEVDNHALQATAWARISFTWTYSGNPSEALRCIEQARRLAIGSTNSTVRAYLAAVEAEIQATFGDSTACLKALDQAEHFEDQQHSLEDSHWLRFDYSRLAGYKGICFRRLYRPGVPQSASFLMEGQNALKDALTQLAPTRLQRQPVLLIDLADTYALQGDVEAACEYATKAIPLIDQIKSRAASRRLLQLRQALKPWQETQPVQGLDNQMEQYSFLRRHNSEEMSK
jgi:transcriptional regulator with XRE-family HTH domain/tetratricopeptide (TPR) repeat protein